MTELSVRSERWPIAGAFTISRGSKTEAEVVVVELSDGTLRGCGECVPYPRYNETVAGVMAALEGLAGEVARGLDRETLQHVLPAGAARNALDCAFIDLEAKRTGRPAYDWLGLAAPQPRVTAYTISLGTPQTMAAAAAAAAARPLLKVKLGGEGDRDRIAAVRKAAPGAELIVDANEGWNAANLAANLAACADAGVTLVEQPLPAADDAALAMIARPIPVCADESVHDRASLANLVGKYDAVNIKLDKAGGLTEALALAAAAEAKGFMLMVGCMISTSLSIAPALLVAQRARVVDLDGPLLLARDRPNGLTYAGSTVHPATRELWG
jgi:L-alanine-DL-glutamate epimerase-like enolase superfamily enzyme